jgi:predicted transcriptional regulator of viral defense system
MNNKNHLISEQLLGPMTEILAAHNAPAISSYELAKHLYFHAQKHHLQPEALKSIFKNICSQLTKLSLLSEIAPFSVTKSYLLFGQSKASPSEIICSIDPFAYISHLSAMEYYGLTDRFPSILYLTRPALTEWRQQAKLRMEHDLHEHQSSYIASGLPKLSPGKILRVNQTPIHICERSQLGAFRLVSGSNLRISSIGRTFLDMIREPSLCGGLQHVVDIYIKEGKQYLNLIIDEIERHGLAIDKVRAGYLLTEVCHLNNPIFDDWGKLVQRGGSRKLDPEGEYSSHFSEKWQLSINLPSLTMPVNKE